MKQINKFLLISTLCVLIYSCSSDKKDVGAKDSTTLVANDSVGKLKVAADQQIYADYLNLKDALVRSSATEAQTAAGVLAGSLEQAKWDAKLVSDATAIASSTDLKAQRKIFTTLSVNMIAKVKALGADAGKIYVQHCPMANNGDGGDWLSAESKIQNPYYGDEMMECGRIVEEIKAK